MPARPRKPAKTPRDVNQNAVRVARIATREEEPPALTRSDLARALGKLGASKGGKARAAALTAKERSEIARKAAEARWSTRES